MSALTPEQRRAEALARASKLPPPRNALDIDAIERPLFELQGGGYDHEDAVDVLVEIWPEIDDSICGAIHHCADFIFRLQWFNNDDMPVAPIAYLIESLLPTQGTTLLPAPTGDGKTLMTMHLGMALLTGKPFFGLSVPEPASVLYLAGEGYEDIAPRFNALCERDGVDPASLSFAPRQVDSIDDIELSIRYIRR
jgi:hypothetical protein